MAYTPYSSYCNYQSPDYSGYSSPTSSPTSSPMSPCYSSGSSNSQYAPYYSVNPQDIMIAPQSQPSYQAVTVSKPIGKATSQTPNTRSAPGTRYPCLFEACTADFSRLTDLKRHMKSVHHPENHMVDCPHKWCGRTGSYGFTRKDHLNEHIREVHKEDIPKARRRRS